VSSKPSTFQTILTALDISLTYLRSDTEPFVFKHVSKPFYDLSLNLVAEFAGSRRLRMHTDYNAKEGVLVYPYFRDTLLAIIQGDPDFPVTERKKK